MMNKPKVSIIVPVFNVKEYLRECLDSILNQTLTDLEVICGDGGSTDGSLDIIKEYAEKDSRVSYISKQGSGYGQSVNECMDIAQGEYIGIVESDDAVKPNTYEVLYGIAKRYSLDWIRGDIYFYYSGMPKGKQLKRESIIYDGDFYNIILNPQTDYRPYKSGLRTWSGIYRTDFLNANDIRHNETQGGSYQDVGFYLKTLYYATRVYFVDQAFYMWRQDNPGSSVHYNSAKLVEKSLKEWKLNQQYLDEHPNIGKRAVASYNYRKFFSYLWTIDMAEGEDKKYVKAIAYKELKKALDNNEIDKAFFEEWEWTRFMEALQEWKIETEEEGKQTISPPDKERLSCKKCVKKALRPIANLTRKIVYKMMRNVLFAIEYDVKNAVTEKNQKTWDRLSEIDTSIQKIIIELEHAKDQISDIKDLQDIVLAQKIQLQDIQTGNADLGRKIQDQGDVLWSIKTRGEDIHDKVAEIRTKVLDQGDIVWSIRDKTRDIELFDKKNADSQIWNLIYELNPDRVAEAISTSPLYDSAFYLNNRYGSVISAQHILSVLFKELPHESIIDFGCGTGTWLWVAKVLGAKTIYGIDGDYVPKALLMIAKNDFHSADLQKPIHLEQTFDLALSMEVAEHLREDAADCYIDNLCGSADLILFSAAHPGQGGDGHINEQHIEYWINKFEARNFKMKKIKHLFENDDKIEWWYKENIALFYRDK